MKINEEWVKNNPKEALDLPVKFAEWCRKSSYIDGDKIRIKPEVLSEELKNKSKVSAKELYDYWIDNIYKPE